MRLEQCTGVFVCDVGRLACQRVVKYELDDVHSSFIIHTERHKNIFFHARIFSGRKRNEQKYSEKLPLDLVDSTFETILK